ncbi:MAG: acylphosphatase [Chloroflexi bacterium]|nr:acylphosphatase [Chloroflexota bacterium]
MRAHVLISGEVQGVFFRESMRHMAERLGVAGWVRNLFDGRVEAMIEGETDQVEGLIEWCREGPPAAQVEEVDVELERFVGDFSGFAVRT